MRGLRWRIFWFLFCMEMLSVGFLTIIKVTLGTLVKTELYLQGIENLMSEELSKYNTLATSLRPAVTPGSVLTVTLNQN